MPRGLPVGAEPCEEVAAGTVAGREPALRADAVVPDGGGGDEDPWLRIRNGLGELPRGVDAAGPQHDLLPRRPPPPDQVLAGQVDDGVTLGCRGPDRVRFPGDVSSGTAAHNPHRVLRTFEPGPEP